MNNKTIDLMEAQTKLMLIFRKLMIITEDLRASDIIQLVDECDAAIENILKNRNNRANNPFIFKKKQGDRLNYNA